MAVVTTQGSLVFIGLNTTAPKMFFNGAEVAGLRDVRVNWDIEDPHVKVKVAAGIDPALKAELQAAGLIVKEV